MTGLWLVSYLVLWVIVVVLYFFLVGVLRQLGLLYRQLAQRPSPPQDEDAIPPLEQDGPAIGSPLPTFELDTFNGFGRLTPSTVGGTGEFTLLVFMSPMCETCQHAVEPLNTLVADATRTVHAVVFIRADEQACRAFLSVFPLHMPVICDRDATITMELGVHRTPFGLLYDERGNLIRKGSLEGREDLRALLGDESASPEAQAHVFPGFVSSNA